MDKQTTAFADWVSVTAKSLGYKTDAALADAIKVQQSTVTRWRQGNQPQIKHLVALARLFGMRIDPLLAMSGHVPADLLGDAGPAEPPTTESVRRIQDAPLSEMQKHALQQYWGHRLDEERSLLNALIEGIVESESQPRLDVGTWVNRMLIVTGHTDRTLHTFQVLQNLYAVEAAPRKRRRRSSQQDDDGSDTE